MLQNAFDDASTDRIQYFVFDIPFHAGLDLREVPLIERRALLQTLLRDSKSPKIRFSESFDDDGAEVLAHACKLGLEGIVGKRRDSGYVSRRSRNWIKVKCILRQEFVIVGYTDPQGSRTGIRGSRPGILAGGLIAAVLLSLIASPAPLPGIPIILHGAIEPILVAFLVTTLRPTRGQILWLGGAIVLGLALASLYSVLRIGRLATTIAGLEAVRVQLAHFTFYNVGLYGIALSMAIPLAVAGLLYWKSIGLRRPAVIGLVALLVVLLAGLYLTFSKSAWLATAFALLVVVVARFRRPWQLAGLTVATAIGLSLFVPYPIYLLRAVNVQLPATNPYVELVTKMSGGRLSSWDVGSPEGEVSITERWRATVAAGRMVVDHPLLGVGPGRFGDEYAGRYADAGATRHLGAPHDLLPEVASELGLVAALLLLVSLLGAAWSAWRAARAPDPLLRTLGAGFGGALAGFVVVTATFGLDLYRDYRVMNSDVVIAGLVVGVCASLVMGLGRRPSRGR